MIVTNCSNNFGPHQHAEKLIPTVIRSALQNAPIPIYGKGTNVRDWLFVDDHVGALLDACESGEPGSTYNIGGDNELDNLSLARRICTLLDQKRPRADQASYVAQIRFVENRPGHDFRYAPSTTPGPRAELGWQPSAQLR